MFGFGKKKEEVQARQGVDLALRGLVESIEAIRTSGKRVELSTLITIVPLIAEHPDLLARVQKVARAQGDAIVRKDNNLIFTKVGSDLDN